MLDSWVIGGTTGGTVFGMIHGCLGQVFFALVTCLALSLSGWFSRWTRNASELQGSHWVFLGTALVFGQLILGLWMRHQHAGLAIPDLPLAYGQWWPKTDAESLVRYVSRREGVDAITALQIHMHLLHRINAVLAVLAICMAFRSSRLQPPGHPVRTLGVVWLCLVGVQFTLGLFTVLTDRAADIATAHVAVGSLTLAIGCWSCWAVRVHQCCLAEESRVLAGASLPEMPAVR